MFLCLRIIARERKLLVQLLPNIYSIVWFTICCETFESPNIWIYKSLHSFKSFILSNLLSFL